MTTTHLEDRRFDLSNAPLRIGLVRLNVRDLRRMSGFYKDALGLVQIGEDAGRVLLGTPSKPLLELAGNPGLALRDPRSAGLFHTAFLLPERGDLGRWLAHARSRGIAVQGASDHLVSEAVYLADPEGNGIEVYADRPIADWPSVNGEIAMSSEPLDLGDLLRAGGAGVWQGAPEGTIVGHMHLQVGNTSDAERFWRDIFGFDVTCRYPGALFFGAGGYHHQIAANIWNSRGAGMRAAEATGLARFQIVAQDRATLDTIQARVAAAGLTCSDSGNGFILKDPWGTEVSLAL